MPDDAYRLAFLDWMACAVRGAAEPASVAARATGSSLLDRVAATGTAGHVLDFDDTYLPGLAHLSAPVAPAALVLGAELDRTVGEVVSAFTAGFEAMGAMARASHPALYDGGWHPTAVCGPVGAAAAASRLLGLGPEGERAATALALLRAGGVRAAFGTQGKSLGVGMAAASGVQAARLAAHGASGDLERFSTGTAGFDEAFGAAFAEPSGPPAVQENWIKAYPCCLQTHGAIDAALAVREEAVWGEGTATIEVTVHPVSVKAAAVGLPADGLEAKFSIPYLTAFTLLRGAPGIDDFAGLDGQALHLAEGRVRVTADPALAESEAVLVVDGSECARIAAAVGSPGNPLGDDRFAAKVEALAGDRLDAALDELGASAYRLAALVPGSTV